MKKHGESTYARRLLAGLLCLTLLIGLVPGVALPVAAAEESWVQPYLNKLVDWGVMRGDQWGSLDPNRPITRAEYVSMINRAYGYTEPGVTPFKDVPTSAWYADDVAIGYRAGYFTGTGKDTAAPEAYLSREQAAVLLGRNMMLQEGAGESLDFTDSRALSDWSRGMIKTAAEYGVVKGYTDGSFLPKNNITRGEVASMLVSALGTPINKPGDYTLGSTYGNVTISASGVTLRNTVIAGDLYLTGGVGLGHVTLENVTVLGKIIASGAGESNKGESSIILRNVTAPSMLVDSPSNQFVTLRAEGNTKIANTSVRTPTYLEDTTGELMGLAYITLDGEAGTSLELAGNIKEVMNLTENSSLKMARGAAQVVTIDEKALGSKLIIEQGGEIKDLRLDVSTPVTGQGDVEKVTISSSGCTISMLPDSITVRPGLIAGIGGEDMNTVTATESSQEPRLLAGYPRAYNVAPVSAGLLFATNKKGTVYWGVSAMADGSVGAEDLIAPPTYGSKMLKSGNIKAEASGTEYTGTVNGLTSDGSYYLSAVMVDARGQQSPVKVAAFGTPNDTVPAFAQGFPYMSQVTNRDAQVTVMTTKSCKLYYALLPKGAAAPKEADFKANAITGNLGFGVRDVEKNSSYAFGVNDKALAELEGYDLYLYLADANGAKSSPVTKLSFTTADKTPPQYVMKPTVTTVQTTSLGMTATINEVGDLYWVVVKAGTEYPKPLAGTGGGTVDLSSDVAKLQVSSGMGALRSGKVAMTANKEASFTISGLTAETSYDLYYVAQDKAGNYSVSVEKMVINTLDNSAPTAKLGFTKPNTTVTENPSADTDLKIQFSEAVQTYPGGKALVDFYSAVLAAKSAEEIKNARNNMADALTGVITLFDLTDGTQKRAAVRSAANEATVGEDWVVDYRYAVITLEDGKTVVTLPTVVNPAVSGLNLRSGSTYRLDLSGISDLSRNAIGTIPLPESRGFTTRFAEVVLKPGTTESIASFVDENGVTQTPVSPVRVDMSFELYPDGTTKVDEGIRWDMMLWSDKTMEFKLFVRDLDKDGKNPGTWRYLGKDTLVVPGGSADSGLSYTDSFLRGEGALTFGPLKELTKNCEYGVSVVALNGNLNDKTWSDTVNFRVGIAAGASMYLGNLAVDVNTATWKRLVKDEKKLTSIGNWVTQGTDELTLEKRFTDKVEPKFINGHPIFAPTDATITATVMTDRESTIYYVVAPAGRVSTTTAAGIVNWADLPKNGTPPPEPPLLTAPGYLDIVNNKLTANNPAVKWGYAPAGTTGSDIVVTDLQPETEYMVYFVLKGSSSVYSRVFCYGVKTKELTRPVLGLDLNNPSVNISADRNTEVDYLLVAENGTPPVLDALLSASLADGMTLPPAYADYTLLKAILTDVKENDKVVCSVFDRYVSADVKKTVASYIRNEVPSATVVLKGKASVTAGRTTTVDCSKNMKEGYYLFLAVGKSPLGSGDAFRAIRPVQLVDSTPPVVNQCLTTLNPSADGKTYSGYLTLAFSEDIYYIERNASDPTATQTIKAVEVSTKLTPSDRDKFVSLVGLVQLFPSATIRASAATMGKPMSIVTFDFTQAKVGDFIVFNAMLGDGMGNTQNAQLTLRLTAPATPDGLPTFVISPAKWDGTNK